MPIDELLKERGGIRLVERIDMFFPAPTCYVCKCTSEGRRLWGVHAPGVYYICDACIEKQEKQNGQVAIYHPMQGVSFVSPETADRLMSEQR